MEWFERNPSGRTYGRTDGRTYGREQIYSPSQILWVGPKTVKMAKKGEKSLFFGPGGTNFDPFFHNFFANHL